MGWCFSSRREGELSSPNKFGSYKAEPGELTGKYIILDVLARDGEGHCYIAEIAGLPTDEVVRLRAEAQH